MNAISRYSIWRIQREKFIKKMGTAKENAKRCGSIEKVQQTLAEPKSIDHVCVTKTFKKKLRRKQKWYIFYSILCEQEGFE